MPILKIHCLKYFTAILFIIFLHSICVAQIISSSGLDSSRKLHLQNIIIKGNKKTKDYIILREMTLKEGDYVFTSNLNFVLEKSKEFIYNTTLFEKVTLDTSTVSSLVRKSRSYLSAM